MTAPAPAATRSEDRTVTGARNAPEHGRPPTWWLARPSRYALFGTIAARVVLALLTALLLGCLTVSSPRTIHDHAPRSDDQRDVMLYDAIVAGVRGGGAYYPVAATALRAGNYPLRPFVTFRLPTLAVLEAAASPRLIASILFVLAALVMVAWSLRLQTAFLRLPPLIIALVLLAGGMAAFVQPALASFHEVWAGLLIALALARRARGRWLESVAIGMMAMLVRETAVLFVGVMAVTALIGGQRREAAGWSLTIAVFALVVAAHAHAVSAVVNGDDPTSPGWNGLLGFGFFVKTMSISTALALAPAPLAALLVGLALFGWSGWVDAMAPRALATIAAFGLLLALFGRADSFYWGLMIAPTLLVGLAFVPDSLRDLVLASRPGRRIIVTRVAP